MSFEKYKRMINKANKCAESHFKVLSKYASENGKLSCKLFGYTIKIKLFNESKLTASISWVKVMEGDSEIEIILMLEDEPFYNDGMGYEDTRLFTNIDEVLKELTRLRTYSNVKK